jgi:hypothetical protein
MKTNDGCSRPPSPDLNGVRRPVMRLITSASMCVVRASRVHTSVNCEELDSPRVRMRTLPEDPLNSSSPCALKVNGIYAP